MPRYAASRTLPASVEDVWAVLAEPGKLTEWWPGLVAATPTVRRALAPGALWQVESTNRASLLRRGPQVNGTLLVLEVVPLQRVAFQFNQSRIDVALDLEPTSDGDTLATLAVAAPRFGGVGRTLPSQALTRLAALVRPPRG